MQALFQPKHFAELANFLVLATGLLVVRLSQLAVTLEPLPAAVRAVAWHTCHQVLPALPRNSRHSAIKPCNCSAGHPS